MNKLFSTILDSSAKVIIKLIHIIRALFSLKTNFWPLPISWKRAFSDVPIWISKMFSASWQPSRNVISILLRVSRWTPTVPTEHLKQWDQCLQISTHIFTRAWWARVQYFFCVNNKSSGFFLHSPMVTLDLIGITKSIILLPWDAHLEMAQLHPYLVY